MPNGGGACPRRRSWCWASGDSSAAARISGLPAWDQAILPSTAPLPGPRPGAAACRRAAGWDALRISPRNSAAAQPGQRTVMAAPATALISQLGTGALGRRVALCGWRWGRQFAGPGIRRSPPAHHAQLPPGAFEGGFHLICRWLATRRCPVVARRWTRPRYRSGPLGVKHRGAWQWRRACSSNRAPCCAAAPALWALSRCWATGARAGAWCPGHRAGLCCPGYATTGSPPSAPTGAVLEAATNARDDPDPSAWAACLVPGLLPQQTGLVRPQPRARGGRPGRFAALGSHHKSPRQKPGQTSLSCPAAGPGYRCTLSGWLITTLAPTRTRATCPPSALVCCSWPGGWWQCFRHWPGGAGAPRCAVMGIGLLGAA